jgi:succinate-semialdehyde dehydrogenase/glutarate-semialdehyde dehydrogenase
MTTGSQVQTVKQHLDDAVEKGALIACKSEVEMDNPQALPAIVLTNVSHDMLVMQEETFGPVMAVMPFDSEEEAIRWANQSELGLTASVWSRNKSRARQIANQIEAGVVVINDHLITHGMPNLPWGGVKESGLGRTHGEFGLLEMTEPRVVLSTKLPRHLMVWWLPVPRWIYKRWVGFMQIVGGPWRQKLRGLVKLISGF